MGINFKLIIFFLFWTLTVFAEDRPVIIWDIDDTLVDTNYRTLEILQEIAVSEGSPELLALEYTQVHFFCSTTCRNAGIKDEALIEKICGDAKKGTMKQSLWGRRFFSDPRYLRYDRLMPGAVEFLERLSKEFDHIYITGRSTEALGAATKRQIEYLGLPDGLLITKPDSYVGKDVDFKKEQLDVIRRTRTVKAAVDDTLVNANMFRKNLPSTAIVIRPTRNVLDRNDLEPGIVQITNYIFDVEVEPDGKQIKSSNKEILDSLFFGTTIGACWERLYSEF